MEAEAEGIVEHRSSLAAPCIFLVVIAFQFLARWLEHLKKGGSNSQVEMELRKSIKQLLREASTLSQPSTFAQAAKLRRLAAAKEKELANYQESRNKEIKTSYGLYSRVLLISKVFMYIALVFWFWRVSVATVPHHLVQPFGRVLSWKAGGIVNDYVKVGIIPWLILSTRVSKYVCRVVR
ncbi:uncharacterized protein LOC111809975 [Cucurbita pepo subsp. pepo]|uniref:uncharacterized protein LOC111809975 n=1 Tax=Cucurbita pepo subsp. pepo TaxID=3664 RepID=UPI000C9D6090|nr:uncharacterized protein LOC111809975 [Cucurbita pepo subsp. pepo]